MVRTSLPDSRVDVPITSSATKSWIRPHLLSLDAVAIALVWQELFADGARLSLTYPERLALACAVWAIYLIDRALDASREGALPTARHMFSRRHRGLVVGLAAISISAGACVSRNLKVTVIEGGLLLSGLVALHFFWIHVLGGKRRWLSKEVSVASLFATGCLLVPITAGRFKLELMLPAVCFAFICLLNCASIEYREWERFSDNAAERPSGTVAWFARNLRPVAAGLALVATALMFATPMREIYGAIAISSLALVWFDRAHHHFYADGMRVAADLPLVAPLLLLFTRAHGL
ncbi:MAG: hypothetical protein M3Y24_11245 [Acidobacteriota bacterium]|nr:hypothetical protein [Acidobacteriota bacterium]